MLSMLWIQSGVSLIYHSIDNKSINGTHFCLSEIFESRADNRFDIFVSPPGKKYHRSSLLSRENNYRHKKRAPEPPSDLKTELCLIYYFKKLSRRKISRQ